MVWDPPAEPNGVLLRYVIYQNGTEIQRVMGNVTSYVVTGLQPFSVYVFKLGVCTAVGCSNSSDSTPQRTLESGTSSLSLHFEHFDVFLLFNDRFWRFTAKDIIPSMDHKDVEPRFSSVVETSPLPLHNVYLSIFKTAQTTAPKQH